jgi:putative spermidine/putrescine transport system ATP-binding protein
VTHDQTEALTMSDRVAVFDDGRIQQLAPPDELYEQARRTASWPSSSARTTR